MKNKKANKTPLIVFSSTLAVLVVAALVCGAIFAGASNESDDLSLEATNSGVVYVQFDKEPTEEEISAVLEEYDVWTKQANPESSKSEKAEVDVNAIEYVDEVKIDGVTYLQFDKGATEEQIKTVKQKYIKSGKTIITTEDGKYIVKSNDEDITKMLSKDISKYIEADNPGGIYIPSKDPVPNVNILSLVRKQYEKIPSIHKFSGQERSASLKHDFYTVIDFCGDRDAFVGYTSKTTYNADGSIRAVTDEYKANDYKASYDSLNKREISFERALWLDKEYTLLGDPELLFSSTPRLVIENTKNWYVKDCGTYLGRAAIRIVGDTSESSDYRDKTGMYSYEFIFDVETNALLSYISYGEGGRIVSYRIITEFSTDDSIEVPLYPNVNKN